MYEYGDVRGALQAVNVLVAGSDSSDAMSLGEAVAETAQAADAIAAAAQAQRDSVASSSSASSSSSSAGNDGGPFEDVGKAVLGGMTFSPIVSGILSLFGGGSGHSTPPVLPRYSAPPSISVEGGVGGGASGPVAVDYDQYGAARTVQAGGSAAPAPQITVNVSAMDSQSFLDRSSDIAQAVRRAMLESSSLNDVVAEL